MLTSNSPRTAKISKAKIATKGIALDRILANKTFGQVATTIEVKGNKDHPVAKGEISRFDYNKYSFRNISPDGQYNHGIVKGLASIDDPNIRVDIEGNYAMKGQQVCHQYAYRPSATFHSRSEDGRQGLQSRRYRPERQQPEQRQLSRSGSSFHEPACRRTIQSLYVSIEHTEHDSRKIAYTALASRRRRRGETTTSPCRATSILPRCSTRY